MTRRIIALALAAVLCGAWVVSADAVAEDLQKEVEALRARLKTLEAATAAKDGSAFSFRMASFLTAASSAYAGDFMSSADVAAAKALINACNSDIASLCKASTAPESGAPGSAWFSYYASVLQCLQQTTSLISATCTTAGRDAVVYMRDNRDTLRLAVRKVSVKDSFEGFKTACATEIVDKCDADVLSVDVTAGIVASPWADSVMRPRPGSEEEPHHREHRHLHSGAFHHVMRALRGSGDAGSHDWSHVISDLNAELGACAAAVEPIASESCNVALNTLGHVALFASARGPGAFNHPRGLTAAGWNEPDAPLDFPGVKAAQLTNDSTQPPPPEDEDISSFDSESTSESEDSDFDEEDDRGYGHGDGRRGSHRGRWHHRQDAGGIVGLMLIIAIIVTTVALFRRRRIIRELRARVQQLEAAAGGRPVAAGPPMPFVSGYPGIAPMHYPGIPMPPVVASAPSAPPARTPSDSEEEHATLLRRAQAPQVVQPIVYPGQMYPVGPGGYPNNNPF